MTGSDQPEAPRQEVSPSVRAQLLATEHRSLLASRSTTQNELLVRIAIFLTLVSASVVSLALVGQATDFDGRFDLFTLVLFSILLLVGTLTLLRYFTAWSWHFLRRYRAFHCDYEALFPHPGE